MREKEAGWGRGEQDEEQQLQVQVGSLFERKVCRSGRKGRM